MADERAWYTSLHDAAGEQDNRNRKQSLSSDASLFGAKHCSPVGMW